MNRESFCKWLAEHSLPERAKMLNLVSFKLTIYAREYRLHPASSDTERAINGLLGLSELHHKLSSQTGHYLNGDYGSPYPVDVFGKILFEVASQFNLTGALNAAIESALDGFPPSQH